MSKAPQLSWLRSPCAAFALGIFLVSASVAHATTYVILGAADGTSTPTANANGYASTKCGTTPNTAPFNKYRFAAEVQTTIATVKTASVQKTDGFSTTEWGITGYQPSPDPSINVNTCVLNSAFTPNLKNPTGFLIVAGGAGEGTTAFDPIRIRIYVASGTTITLKPYASAGAGGTPLSTDTVSVIPDKWQDIALDYKNIGSLRISVDEREAYLSQFELADPNPSETVAPTVTSITRQTPATSPTDADSLTWRVTFSEDMQFVNAGRFGVTGTTATVTGVTQVDAKTYDVTVSGGDLPNLSGTVQLTLQSPSGAQDLAGNYLSSTTPTGANDDSYQVSNAPPAPPAPIPTLSEWLMILLVGLLGIIGYGTLRRRLH